MIQGFRNNWMPKNRRCGAGMAFSFLETGEMLFAQLSEYTAKV